MGFEARVILAGFGGQGVLFAGKVMAYAGLIEDRELSWLPSYGPEMRGGTANCSVTLSDSPVGSPNVTEPNIVIAMNQPSFDKFIDAVVPQGLLLVDTDMVTTLQKRDGIRIVGVPATGLAEEGGLKGLSNIILLGKLWAECNFCKRATLDAAIDKCVPPKKAALIEKNKQAIEIGISYSG